MIYINIYIYIEYVFSIEVQICSIGSKSAVDMLKIRKVSRSLPLDSEWNVGGNSTPKPYLLALRLPVAPLQSFASLVSIALLAFQNQFSILSSVIFLISIIEWISSICQVSGFYYMTYEKAIMGNWHQRIMGGSMI